MCVERIAPTREAIDDWRNADDRRGVDIRTRSGSWRCISGIAYQEGVKEPIGYWTIRAEGSSNEGAETWIAFDRISEARGWTI